MNKSSGFEIVADTKVLEILKDLKADIQTIATRSDTHPQMNGKLKYHTHTYYNFLLS